MENNFTNVFKDLLPQQEEGSQELLYLFEQIMRLPDTLEQENVDNIINLINQNFTEEIREEGVKNIIKNFEKEKLTRQEVINQIEEEKRIIQEVIDENLAPSPIKRQLLDRIFEIFYDIFDRAIDRYHNYSIQLPMKLDEGGKIPTYAHETDACADIYASRSITIPAHARSVKVPTGLHVALPEGWVAKIAPRSSIGAKTGLRLSNSIGIIDADYRGEIGVLYDNISDSDYEINCGDRIAQIWIERVERFKPVLVDILPATERGSGGFGSTGK